MRLVATGSFGVILALAAVLGGFHDAAEAQGEGSAPSDEESYIFGEDNRVERHQLDTSDPRYELARSSVALFSEDLIQMPDGGWLVEGGTLGRNYNLCEGERFAEQPAGDRCSGTLVGADLVLTAGHCLANQEGLSESSAVVESACARMKIAFDYAYDVEEADPSRLADEDVFQCEKVLALEYDRTTPSLVPIKSGPWLDYAIIKLDRPAGGREPVTLQDGAGVEKGRTVTLLGHPSGLPLKIVDGSVARAAECRNFGFDTDTLTGNSGGGVFDPLTGHAVGVFRGPRAYGYSYDVERKCSITGVCGLNVDCSHYPFALATEIPLILSRLSDEVRAQLEIVEVGGPSKCR